MLQGAWAGTRNVWSRPKGYCSFITLPLYRSSSRVATYSMSRTTSHHTTREIVSKCLHFPDRIYSLSFETATHQQTSRRTLLRTLPLGHLQCFLSLKVLFLFYFSKYSHKVNKYLYLPPPPPPPSSNTRFDPTRPSSPTPSIFSPSYPPRHPSQDITGCFSDFVEFVRCARPLIPRAVFMAIFLCIFLLLAKETIS